MTFAGYEALGHVLHVFKGNLLVFITCLFWGTLIFLFLLLS